MWLASPSGAAFRFDGSDDLFERTGLGQSLTDFTVFIVAAPHSNVGQFRGLIAVNASDRRDYDTGFTIDLGPQPTKQFDVLNIEGFGFGGAVDLMNSNQAFGSFQTIETHGSSGPSGIRLLINGQPQNSRPRTKGGVRVDDITVGARFYSNDQRPAFTQGYFDGDIAEIIVFDHDLNEAECTQVRSYLSSKYNRISTAFSERETSRGSVLKRLTNPPAVQMFAPGFIAEELPLKLPNINNLRCRADGKIVAVAYNGDVLLLTDTNKDGLPDHAETFWKNDGRVQSPIGAALSPRVDPRGKGVYIACTGKVFGVFDTNGDDRADREIIIAEGWKSLEGTHGVDALGIAIDNTGAIYFGLGAANYANAYQRDASGKGHFDLKSDRGTIQRIAPDLKSREIMATGVRFSVGLAFNLAGDLFATDQEGATWLPNGNPFDELLHILPGRHYGFPPRHPKDLPNVIDEPSVFDFTPQHQSTCGLTFNVPVAKDGPVFGPDSWRNDAITCGYSRGKLYRTKLVKTPAGYVASNQLIGSLNMLTVDSCVTSDGSLLVATHSGEPDWGSGPQGVGKLYRIKYVGREEPQPVGAWFENEYTIRMAFDRPLSPARLADLGDRVVITRGPFVSAGDRFEAIRPGYDVVAAQESSTRNPVPIHSRSVTPDRRTILFAVESRTQRMPYAISLPGGEPTKSKLSLPQINEIDLAFAPSGVEATWTSADGKDSWSGTIPHIDLAVSKEFTAGSHWHDTLWTRLKLPGKLVLKANLDLSNMLRPAVQSGSKLDYTLPDETVTLSFTSSGTLVVPEHHESLQDRQGEQLRLTYMKPHADFHPITLALNTGQPEVNLSVSWHTSEDSRPRPLPLKRIALPWTRANSSAALPTSTSSTRPELVGGNWLRGRDIFLGPLANCAKCHSARGEGGKIGPDLSNLIHRDYTSVLRDIQKPNAAINPDYLTHHVALSDGRTLEGTTKFEGDHLIVADREGKITQVDRSLVESTKPAPLSIMPEKLLEPLSSAQIKDLLTFLLIPAIDPAPIHRNDAPPVRSKADVEAILKNSRTLTTDIPRPLRIVLIDGPKDHGLDEHDYPAWSERWSSLLGFAPGVTVSRRSVWPTAEDLAEANVLVWFSANPGWTAERGKELDTFLARGGGMVYLHYAVNGIKAPEALAERIGLSCREGVSKYRHGPVKFVVDPKHSHPITSGFTTIDFIDESYWNLTGDTSKITTLATSLEEGEPRPMLWTREHQKGRVVGCLLGHYTWTFDDPFFRILILRSIAWSAGEPIDRLSALANVGSR